MSVYSAEYHAMIHSPASPAPAASNVEQVTVSAPKSDGGGFFHHLLDVINPLQHLPVIGTIYRAITGEHIGPVEKIAGDALYGGMWGAITSVADVAFESITGKSAEDTVLAWVTRNGHAIVVEPTVGNGEFFSALGTTLFNETNTTALYAPAVDLESGDKAGPPAVIHIWYPAKR